MSIKFEKKDTSLSLCRYNIILLFSAYDVLNGEEMTVDTIIFDDVEQDSSQVTFDPVTKRYMYRIQGTALQTCKIELRKKRYFPYIGKFKLNVTSVFDDAIEIDLGRLGLLSEIKEDAIVLLWDRYPEDLDLRLQCPNGEIVGVAQYNNDPTKRENYFAEVLVDAKNGNGPETVAINRWTNADLDSKYKIGGHYEVFVNWFKDYR